MASPEVCGRQRRDEELLVLPVVGVARPDLAAGDAAQLAGLSLDDLVAGHVLDGLEIRREGANVGWVVMGISKTRKMYLK